MTGEIQISLTAVIGLASVLISTSFAIIGYLVKKQISTFETKITSVDGRIESALDIIKRKIEDFSKELKDEQSKNQKEIRDLLERIHKLELQIAANASKEELKESETIYQAHLESLSRDLQNVRLKANILP